MDDDAVDKGRLVDKDMALDSLPGVPPDPTIDPVPGYAGGAGSHIVPSSLHESVRPWRIRILALVLVVVVGVGLLAHVVGSKHESSAVTAASTASLAAPSNADSANWYCAGGTGTSGTTAGNGPATATLYLANSSAQVVQGSVIVVSAAGKSATSNVLVPANGQATFVPASIVRGGWLAAQVSLFGGGVTVNQVVVGPLGWSASPCASETSPTWYFPDGATDGGATMFLALFNPSVTTSVVDTTFITRVGPTQPAPFEGLIVPPGSVLEVPVAELVQNQRSIATLVQTRSGQVVAEELEERPGATGGLSVVLGAPAPTLSWALPRTINESGSAVTMSVLNPTTVAESVSLRVGVPSGLEAPINNDLPPDSVWTVDATMTNRIPMETDYSVQVTVDGGPGVVVSREIQAAKSASSPRWGMVLAIAGSSSGFASHQWLLVNPAGTKSPPLAGAIPYSLELCDSSSEKVAVQVEEISRTGIHPFPGIPILHMKAGDFAVIEPQRMSAIGPRGIIIRATGPVAVMESASPSGAPGVVEIQGVPFES